MSFKCKRGIGGQYSVARVIGDCPISVILERRGRMGRFNGKRETGSSEP